MGRLDGGPLEDDVVGIVAADLGVAILEMVKRDSRGGDVLVDPDKVRFIRIKTDTKTWN